jgi:protein-arginine kinase activator protein McsA
MIDLNNNLLHCPHCHWMPVAIEVARVQKGDQIEQKVRCWDCGEEYWVTWDATTERTLSAEEELTLWRG